MFALYLPLLLFSLTDITTTQVNIRLHRTRLLSPSTLHDCGYGRRRRFLLLEHRAHVESAAS